MRCNLRVRWKTVRWPTSFAMIGIIWTAVAPAPITATRLPAKSTFSLGHREVWNDSPLKLSTPSNGGILRADKIPTAATRNCARSRCPLSSWTSHRLACSSKTAEVTRELNWMSRRRSNLSAT